MCAHRHGDIKVTTIIPTFNRAELLAQALESVLQQSVTPDEIIVVDDGSTDDTPEVLLLHKDRVRIIRQENRGVSAARNRGIQNARHEWLAFLDSDDLWLPRKLETQIKALQEQGEYKVCYTNEEWRKNNVWKNPGKKHQKYSGWIYEKCLPLCIISPSSVILHKSVFETVGLFDENLPACEDYDLWLRVASRFPVLYLPQRLIVKRAGDWPQLSGQHSLDKYRIMALSKILHSGALDEKWRQATLDMLKYKCDVYALGCEKHKRWQEVEWVDKIRATFNIARRL